MDEFDRLVIDTARKIIAGDAACPGSEESANLKMAQEILAGIGLSVVEDRRNVVEDRRNGGSIGLAPAPIQLTGKTTLLYCAEKQRLLEAFTASVQEMMALQQQQVAALMRGDQDFSRFDLLIHMAEERKRQAKYAYLEHVDAHGC